MLRVGIASSLAELSCSLRWLSELQPTWCAGALQVEFGSSHMALELNSKIARKIGLRREELPYAHLHEQFGREPSAEHDKAETDIYRPPLSDSDEKSPSLPPTPNPKPESSPPSKRRRRDTRSSQQIDLTNPPSGKKEQHSADIQRTTFTSTNRSSSHHSGNAENKAPPSSSESRAATKNDTDELFPGYAASQGKAPITYQRNIHKSAPSKPGKKQGAKKREKTELPVKLSSDGFKTVDTESICALGTILVRHPLWHVLIVPKYCRLKKGTLRPILSNQWDHLLVRDRRGRGDVQQTNIRMV